MPRPLPIALCLVLLGACSKDDRKRVVVPPGSTTGCGCEAGQRCCDAATLGLAADVCVPEDQACPLACGDSDVACPIGAYCLEEAGGAISCSDECDGALRCGFNGCCPAGAACGNDGCVASDLAADDVGLAASLAFRLATVDPTDCWLAAGCYGDSGERHLMDFAVAIANLGPGDLTFGVPSDSSLLQPTACDPDRYWIRNFIGWRLRDAQDAVVAEGSLPTECVADGTSLVPGDEPVFTCGFQGLSAGWSALQPAGSDCAAADITDVAPGDYALELTVNAGSALADADSMNNTVTVPVTVPDQSCAGTVCGSICCEGPCESGVCMLPDLGIDTDVLANSQWIQAVDFSPSDCAIVEGCVMGPGRRRLLRFTTTTPNTGTADLFLGDPDNNPAVEFSPCHGHYHFSDYATYSLKDQSGNVVATGHKQAFCLLDSERIDDDASPFPTYHCDFQGISAGWADSYSSALDCQWVDITGVPEGDYFLEVAINPVGVITELDYTNNTGSVPVHIPADPNACVPMMEVCGDGIDQNCDGIPDDGCPPVTGNDGCMTAHDIPQSGLITAEITSGHQNALSPSCGGAGRDALFRFTLPAAEIVYVSTYGSSIDTVLSLHQDTCATNEVHCSDDDCGTAHSSLAAELAAGTYYIGVKAKNAADTGLLQLKVQRAGCAGIPILPGLGMYPGNTQGAQNNTRSTCSEGGDGPEELHAIAACPGDTHWRVSTCGTIDFDSTLEMRRGACDGPTGVGACNDDARNACPSARRSSQFDTHLSGSGAGDDLWFIVVDGYYASDDGDYTLTISEN